MRKSTFRAAVIMLVLMFAGTGCSLEKIKTQILNNFGATNNATTTPDLASSTPTSLTDDQAEATLLKYNLNRFKNKKWSGEIKQTVEGTVATGMEVPGLDNHIMLAMNYTLEIDEMAIDFDNLSWAKKAQKLGIANTASSTAISIVGKGQVKFINPWRTFFTANIKDEITSNPLAISFAGYIDFANNKLMFFEQFTNHPMLTIAQTSCAPILGCVSTGGSQEWKADRLWLRGMTFKLEPNGDLTLKEPIWNLAELIYQRQMIGRTPGATLNSMDAVKLEANGTLKIGLRNNY